MTNASKIGGKREKKVKQPRAKKVKVDLAKLQDIVVDRKIIVPVGTEVFFIRVTNGKSAIHEGTILSVDANGVVNVWDETRGQHFMFDLNQELPIIKAAIAEASDGPKSP